MTVAVAMLAAFLRAASLSPADATRLACHVERYADCGEVLDIMRSESRGVAVGVHAGHAARTSAAVFWRAAVRAGMLHPEACEAHQQTDGALGWGPRGVHGLAAAYSLHVLGDCVAPEALDVHVLSAVATIRRLRVLRDRYGLRTVDARALAWRVGVGKARRHAAW